ncbi:hypothetical protein K474DRAFT_1663917 [Panus rudis PR-1116 ss-1]|nr:hypothetical protein K474DRAFT_1663917 [Panus rudis PR-1116 ss-1]
MANWIKRVKKRPAFETEEGSDALVPDTKRRRLSMEACSVSPNGSDSSLEHVPVTQPVLHTFATPSTPQVTPTSGYDHDIEMNDCATEEPWITLSSFGKRARSTSMTNLNGSTTVLAMDSVQSAVARRASCSDIRVVGEQAGMVNASANHSMTRGGC